MSTCGILSLCLRYNGWGSLADAQSAPVELPADSDGSGRGSSESHQHSETLPPRATAASHTPASRLARHASAPPGQHQSSGMITHKFNLDLCATCLHTCR